MSDSVALDPATLDAIRRRVQAYVQVHAHAHPTAPTIADALELDAADVEQALSDLIGQGLPPGRDG